MAIKIEFFDSYELNGKTYAGKYPIYSSDAVCAEPSTVDYENILQKELDDTDEES